MRCNRQPRPFPRSRQRKLGVLRSRRATHRRERRLPLPDPPEVLGEVVVGPVDRVGKVPDAALGVFGLDALQGHSLVLRHAHLVREPRVVLHHLVAEAGEIRDQRLDLALVLLVLLLHLELQLFHLVFLLSPLGVVCRVASLDCGELLLRSLERCLRSLTLELALLLLARDLLFPVGLLAREIVDLLVELEQLLLRLVHLSLQPLHLRLRFVSLTDVSINLFHVLDELLELRQGLLTLALLLLQRLELGLGLVEEPLLLGELRRGGAVGVCSLGLLSRLGDLPLELSLLSLGLDDRRLGLVLFLHRRRQLGVRLLLLLDPHLVISLGLVVHATRLGEFLVGALARGRILLGVVFLVLVRRRLGLALSLELRDLFLELLVTRERGIVRGLLLRRLLEQLLVFLEHRLAEFGKVDDGADVAPGARVLRLDHVAHGEVVDANVLHELEKVAVELERADGLLVELGELQAVGRSFEIRRVHLLARFAAQEDDQVLVNLEEGVGVGSEELLLRDGDVQLGEARDDVVVAQDGERVRRRHGARLSSLAGAFSQILNPGFLRSA
mmetsp:Transcript_7374/g.29881  ORF Transcript_7374/g.29881 Transcript_7374/m.29881 type:complete len:557 (+) Transcript_7374:1139-2809(+)